MIYLIRLPSHLEEIECKSHVAKNCWVVRAQRHWHSLVQQNRKSMHWHRRGQSLPSYQHFYTLKIRIRWFTNISFLVSTFTILNLWISKINTYDIGQTSTAIPFSLHVSISLGCFTSEYLDSLTQ